MKSNSKAILLAFFRGDSQLVPLPVVAARLAVPTLSDSGWRSLLYGLAKHGYLDLLQNEDQRVGRVSSLGEQALKALFPALFSNQLALEWNCVFCLKAPRQDPGFRYFRAKILQYGGIPLQRGSYLLPGTIPKPFLDECALLYPSSVMIGKVSEWILGNSAKVFKEAFMLQDISGVYSGVSTEISRLLAKNNVEIQLIQRENKQVSSLFNRLMSAMTQDPGFVAQLLPNTPLPRQLITDWQSLAMAAT